MCRKVYHRHSPAPAALPPLLSRSPRSALIVEVVGWRLGCHIPVRLSLNSLALLLRTTVRRHGLCRRKRPRSRHHSRRSERGQSRGRTWPALSLSKGRIRGVCGLLSLRRLVACGGRPVCQTRRHLPVRARSQSARPPYGTARCARGDGGCRLWWVWLAEPVAVHAGAHAGDREHAVANGGASLA